MRYSAAFVRQTPSGKWAGVLKYRDPEGHNRQVTRTLGTTRSEAEAALPAWRNLMEAEGEASAQVGTTARTTVEEAVRSCLESQLARGRIERSTHDVQMALAKRYLLPELGSEPIFTLSPAHVGSWLDALCLKVSPGTARMTLSILRKAATKANGNGQAPNPTAGVIAPPRTRPRRVYLPDASVALLEEAVDARWGSASPRALAVRLGLLAGLRAGECCGLTWRDVSENGSRVRVVRAVGRSTSGCYLKGPKNPTSAREFPVVAQLARALEAGRMAAEGGGPGGSWFVCGTRDEFGDPRALSVAFATLCAEVGVTDSEGRRATFHTLRHTFATRAVHAGVDVRTLADLLGHADAKMTLNVYAASGEDAKSAAVARLESAI